MATRTQTYEIDVADVEYLRHGETHFLARVFKPIGKGPFPIMIELHGGAWVRGTRMNGEGGEEKPIPVPMTRSDVADYLGLTVETVSRTLSRLKKSGLIEISEAHRITITQLDALQDIAEGF